MLLHIRFNCILLSSMTDDVRDECKKSIYRRMTRDVAMHRDAEHFSLKANSLIKYWIISQIILRMIRSTLLQRNEKRGSRDRQLLQQLLQWELAGAKHCVIASLTPYTNCPHYEYIVRKAFMHIGYL